MFLGVILFVILSTQVLAANHVPELSISEPMASKKSRLMFSKSNNSMTVSESLMAKENTEDRFRRHAEILLEAAKIRRCKSCTEPSISEPMASMKNRLMFSKSDSMTVSESLMAKESSSERIQRHIESFEEMMDKSDKQDDEENKVFFDVEEAKLQKSVEEDGVLKHDEEDKVSLSDEIL
ncbi:hypothetical protein P8452_20015 [Trifolium repens]|nr:hypothetical protein P8452_20015 [Trifolium repens]